MSRAQAKLNKQPPEHFPIQVKPDLCSSDTAQRANLGNREKFHVRRTRRENRTKPRRKVELLRLILRKKTVLKKLLGENRAPVEKHCVKTQTGKNTEEPEKITEKNR
jgi:hypothetical protein